MDIGLLSDSFAVRRLNARDIELIYDLRCENTAFYKYHPPFVTKESILEDIEVLPSGKNYNDKFFVGFFGNDILVAIYGSDS